MRDLVLVFIVFNSLSTMTLLTSSRRKRLLQRCSSEWLIDACGLLIQGLLIPLFQLYVVVALWTLAAPACRGTLQLPGYLAFLLNFVLVDYLYYWNHRLLHQKTWWPLHHLHHSSKDMNLFITSRNSVWSSLFIIYVWANGTMVFLLSDPSYYLWAAALSASLDLWRHSGIELENSGSAYKILKQIFVMPQHHEWHHSSRKHFVNFGANFVWWDKLHGTYYATDTRPDSLGVPVKGSTFQKLFFPYTNRKSS